MPEILFTGPEGRLEGRYHPQREKDAPIALILHPHPQFGGTMNCLLYTSPSPRDGLLSRMPSSA